jgi:hypothetical protein
MNLTWSQVVTTKSHLLLNGAKRVCGSSLQGVLAYVFVRPTLAAIQVLCMMHGTWGEGHFTFRKGWLWCMLTNNVTQVRRAKPGSAWCVSSGVRAQQAWCSWCIERQHHATLMRH